MKKRILVCGGRDYNNQQVINTTLDYCAAWFDPEFVLIHGGARGADRGAMAWAFFQGCPVIEMKANWDHYGKRAGMLRNTWMIQYAAPDLVIAFPGGVGTAGMVKLAIKAGIPVHRVI